jgi:hypothetical protein
MLMALAFLLTLAGAALLARRASRRAAAARAAEEVRVEREAARRTWLRVDPDIGAAIRPARRAGGAQEPLQGLRGQRSTGTGDTASTTPLEALLWHDALEAPCSAPHPPSGGLCSGSGLSGWGHSDPGSSGSGHSDSGGSSGATDSGSSSSFSD